MSQTRTQDARRPRTGTRPGSTSQEGAAKPRLLFLRPTREDLPEFVRLHLREHVRALQHSFEVTLVTGDADFDRLVDQEQPDLVLFESGVYARTDRRITGTHRHPDVPRLGLLNADAYCLTRSVFLADMDDWGVETFFTIGAATPAHTPDLADRLFVWPNFADRSVFHTYPGGKSTTVLLAGSREAHYPWRVQVDRELARRFPVRSLPHAGWFDRDAASAMPSGEAWARTLSAAQIVPTCGTVAEELVRKHLEIPAAGALLLTERTAVVEAAGFVDMESAVFADASDAADKVEHLLANPDVLDRIAAAGQRLAHERHDISTRDQLLQWLRLSRACSAGQVILQPDLFGPLELHDRGDAGAAVGRESSPGSVPVIAVAALSVPGKDGMLLRQADAELRLGQVGAAAANYAAVLNRHLEPEAALGLARTYLRFGDATAAADLLWFLIDRMVNRHGARRPDPVEWATYVRSVLACGFAAEAQRLAGRFPELGHPELRRTRHLLAALVGEEPAAVGGRLGLRSVHVVTPASWHQWREAAVADLVACGQPRLADRAALVPTPPEEREQDDAAAGVAGSDQAPWRRLRRTWRSRGAVSVTGAARRRLATPRRDPEIGSLFQLVAGEGIDVVVTVLLEDAETQHHLDRLVAADPTGATLCRIGRDTATASPATWGAYGRAPGVSPPALSRLPLLGSSIVVAGPRGGALLELSHLAGCRMLVLEDADGPGHARITAELGRSGAWAPAEDQVVGAVRQALRPRRRVAVWRAEPS